VHVQRACTLDNSGHHPVFGHRGLLVHRLREEPTSLDTTVVRTDLPGARYTTSTDVTAPGLSTDEREELCRLRREVKVLAEEREILKKPRPSSPR